MFVIDTRDRAPYAQSRFVLRFKWAETDRAVLTYTARVFKTDWRVKTEVRHSLAGQFRHQWETGNLDPDSPFIRYFMSDVPHALENWQHICRVAANAS